MIEFIIIALLLVWSVAGTVMFLVSTIEVKSQYKI